MKTLKRIHLFLDFDGTLAFVDREQDNNRTNTIEELLGEATYFGRHVYFPDDLDELIQWIIEAPDDQFYFHISTNGAHKEEVIKALIVEEMKSLDEDFDGNTFVKKVQFHNVGSDPVTKQPMYKVDFIFNLLSQKEYGYTEAEIREHALLIDDDERHIEQAVNRGLPHIQADFVNIEKKYDDGEWVRIISAQAQTYMNNIVPRLESMRDSLQVKNCVELTSKSKPSSPSSTQLAHSSSIFSSPAPSALADTLARSGQASKRVRYPRDDSDDSDNAQPKRHHSIQIKYDPSF